MTGYESKRAAAQAKTIDEVNWADHEPNGLAQPTQKCPNIKNCGGACFQCEYFNAEKGEMEYPVAQPAQEPIGYAVPTFDFDNSVIKKVHYAGTVPLYTAPPQRPWVGLTKKEVHDLYDSDYVVFHQRIEAKLKEKNT